MKKILISAVLVSASLAHAEFLNGNDLLRNLNSYNAVEKTFATGFVAGVMDSTMGFLVCVPIDVKLKQITDISRIYIQNNPQTRHHTAAGLVVKAASSVWPCKNQPTKSSAL